ncbi:hypothetical protein Cgig2_014353 [Carnegiea gigantea]|uniref:F-box domain-containing protein n=1 Tax=Carnegiea gigantea TaxID=171969 RepID=A0A9Q1QHE1_9CARY|nr:hypothetical protein Cgig2_014353 [Carnegiea gigantea]
MLEEMLCRMSVRQLLQLRCVSKLWHSLIDKHTFIMKHYQARYKMLKEENDIPFFTDKPSVYGSSDPVHFYLLSKKFDNFLMCLTPDLHRDAAPYFIDNSEISRTLYCAGVVHGVVLLHWFGENLGLWNPATREFKLLPRPRSNLPDHVKEYVGTFNSMGFDPKSNDLKIVRSVDLTTDLDDAESEQKLIYETYSLRANSWKSLEEPHPHLYFHDSVSDGCFNGVHYWPADELDSGTFCALRTVLLSFDYTTDSFRLLDAPPTGYEDESKGELSIAKYKELLAVLFTDKGLADNMCRIDVWVATRFDENNHGIPLSWDYVLSIGPMPKFHNLWFTAFLPDGDVLLTLQGGHEGDVIAFGHETTVFNISALEYKRLGVGLACCAMV